MTQRFLRTWLSPLVLASSPAGHQPDDPLRQRITRRRGAGSPGRGHPSACGPDPSRRADPAGVQGWERDRGARMLPGGSPPAQKDCQSPLGEKVRRHLSRDNFSSKARLELSSSSGRLHSPKRPCRSRSNPGAPQPRPRPAAANHRAPREGKAGGRGQPQSDGTDGQ